MAIRLPAMASTERLFDAMSRCHFDVFLDRFGVEVGADFHPRILRELAHKQMAVFLESQDSSGRSAGNAAALRFGLPRRRQVQPIESFTLILRAASPTNTLGRTLG
jgi:hypothetical protein